MKKRPQTLRNAVTPQVRSEIDIMSMFRLRHLVA
jgi:hypothetical protein